MSSMDDMMNMSFDELRNEVSSGGSSVAARSHQSLARGALSMGHGAPRALHASRAPAVVEVPDHAQELQVYFHGKGAEYAARSVGPGCLLEASQAALACKGKRDFILFEPLDDAARDGVPIVLVTPLRAARSELKGAQVYLASSLAQWLGEQKTDGAGRSYGECKDEDPTLRKHFTRAQILAIRQFGGAP